MKTLNKMTKVNLRTEINRFANINGSLQIHNTDCVNSKWIALWLAQPHQEHCQCGFECKIKVTYGNYEYVLTERELRELIEQITNSPL
jgi:hypothetical protein